MEFLDGMEKLLSKDKYIARSDYYRAIEKYCQVVSFFDNLCSSDLLGVYCQKNGLDIQSIENALLYYHEMEDLQKSPSCIDRHNEAFLSIHQILFLSGFQNLAEFFQGTASGLVHMDVFSGIHTKLRGTCQIGNRCFHQNGVAAIQKLLHAQPGNPFIAGQIRAHLQPHRIFFRITDNLKMFRKLPEGQHFGFAVVVADSQLSNADFFHNGHLVALSIE